MSIAALNWALKTPTGHPGTNHVLLILANYADEAGSCYPSQEFIARVTGYSLRAVRNYIKRLRDSDLVRLGSEPAGGRTRRRNRYWLNMPPSLVNDSNGEPPTYKQAPGAAFNEAGGAANEAPGAGEMRHDVPPTLKRDSQEDSSEREIAAEAGETETATADPDLERLIAMHPLAATEDAYPIEDAWDALSPADRKAAVGNFERWLDAHGPRKRILSLAKYLAQRLWTRLPADTGKKAAAATVADDEIRLDAFSREWWAWWFRCALELDAWGRAEARRRGQLAKEHAIGATVKAKAMPHAESFVSVPVGSDQVAAWIDYVDELMAGYPAGDRAHITLPDTVEWIFVPTDYPPTALED